VGPVLSGAKNICSVYATELLHHCFPLIDGSTVNCQTTLTVVAISVLVGGSRKARRRFATNSIWCAGPPPQTADLIPQIPRQHQAGCLSALIT